MKAKGRGLPWWGWALLVLGVLGVVLTAGLHLLIVSAVSYAKSQPKDGPPAVEAPEG